MYFSALLFAFFTAKFSFANTLKAGWNDAKLSEYREIAKTHFEVYCKKKFVGKFRQKKRKNKVCGLDRSQLVKCAAQTVAQSFPYKKIKSGKKPEKYILKSRALKVCSETDASAPRPTFP